MTLDLFGDDHALARAQLASGLVGVAEGTLRRRIRALSAMNRPGEEMDVARLLLASTECVIDVRDVAPACLERQGRSVLRLMHVEDAAANEATGRMRAPSVSPIITIDEDTLSPKYCEAYS